MLIGKKDIGAIAATAVSALLFMAWMATFLYTDRSYMERFALVFLTWTTGMITYFFIVRPMQGLKPLFRQHREEKYETSFIPQGLKPSRLLERYRGDEFLLLFGLLAVCIGAILYLDTHH